MKKLCFFLLWTILVHQKTFAQLYAPEIKVKATDNNNIGIGADNPLERLTISNGEMSLYGSGLDGSAYQKFKLYCSTQFGLHFDAPKNSTGNRLPIVFSWRGDVNPVLYIKENRYVGVNCNNPSEQLHVNGNILASNLNCTSDRKLKKDIKSYDQGLDLIKQINPVEFKYKARKIKKTEPEKDLSIQGDRLMSENLVEDNRSYIGVIAQDIQTIAPDLVGSFIDDEGEETLTVNHTALTFILINAIKEQQALIEELQQEIKTLNKGIREKDN